MTQKHTEISEIGEFGLIERIRQLINYRVDDANVHDNLVLGISDDTAVFRPTPGKVQLFTTDAFVEGIHFDLTFTSLRHLGWKVMAANISDIAAMGGTPRYATISLSLPKKISLEMVEEFYHGVSFACKKYSCLLVGGDTTSSLANMMVSVAMIGEADEQKIVYRSGAKAGDLVCVTGHLGASLAGLKVLEREKKRFSGSNNPTTFQPKIEQYEDALEKHLMPKPRLDISKILIDHIKVNAMIDISDGLSSELHHLCKSSDTGITVYEQKIPITTVTKEIASEFSELPTQYALYGGEEYELLFTLTEGDYNKLQQFTSDTTIIGQVTEKKNGIELIRENGEHETLRAGGWDHFRI